MTTEWHPNTSRLGARLARVRARIQRLPDRRVKDPRGGRMTVRQLEDRSAALHARIDAEDWRGSEMHRRVGGVQRRLAYALSALDALVAFWFLAGVLNVDLRRWDPTFMIAVALAMLCTLGVGSWNTTTGQHLRAAKDHCGRLVWDAVDGVGRIMVTAASGIWLLLGGMMYLRVSDEVYQATGRHGSAAVVIGLALGVSLVLVNACVLHTCFRDGSADTFELDQLGRTLAAHHRRHSRWLAQEARLAGRLEARARARFRVERVVPRPAPEARTFTARHPTWELGTAPARPGDIPPQPGGVAPQDLAERPGRIQAGEREQ